MVTLSNSQDLNGREDLLIKLNKHAAAVREPSACGSSESPRSIVDSSSFCDSYRKHLHTS